MAIVREITKGLKDLELKDSSSRVRVNINKEAKYLKDKATALNKIFESLNKDNQALFNKYKTTYKF